VIRKYYEKEIPILIEVWEQSSSLAHPFLDIEFTQIVKKEMTEMYLPNSDTWVFIKSKKIVGFISMIENEIGGLFVSPEHLSKGIGTSLVNFIKQFHKELEVEVFELNEIGNSFYKKYGFKVIKEYIHEGSNQKVIRMKKIY